MEYQDPYLQIQELEKTVRVLRKKLERSERERSQIESDIATKESLLKNVIHELKKSQNALEQQSQDLQSAMNKMQLMQVQMIQSEKMSVLGQTIAGIAHEINNPICFIYGNLGHLASYIQDLFKLIQLYHRYYPSPSAEFCLERKGIDMALIEEDIPQILQSMDTGARRIRDLVLALRKFSRLDEVGYKTIDIHESIDNTLMILQQKMVGIEVLKHYDDLPLVTCVAGDLNQVLVNLLSNAIDAIAQKMPQKKGMRLNAGVISIRTQHLSDQEILIAIEDNGIGIEPDIINKIFDPFFTTKEIGKGTGLGLAIARQIVVDKHGGRLDARSEVGQGTQFRIKLPIQP